MQYAMATESQLITIDKVCIGMFIQLDLSWFEHSFPMNSFKISNQGQIDELRALQLKHVRYIPSKSDPASTRQIERPVPPAKQEAQAAAVPPNAQVFTSVTDAKRARLEKLEKQREQIARCEAKFVHAASTVRNINKNIFSRPQETIAEAGKLIDVMSEVFLNENDTIMHLIQKNFADEDMYFHSLNVSVLAMMLANEQKCTQEQIKAVGMAAIFHDIGKANVPDKVLMKTEPLTRAEEGVVQLHTQHGVEIGRKAGMSDLVLEVIANHHEYMDGTGYPRGLKGNAIPMITRIVTIANVYDNLCNHIDHRQSLTPHEALSRMYAHRRAQFDPAAMATLVKCLGVYPPGTLVRLSNEAIGLVMNVNVGKPLRPRVLIYDAEIPKESPIILDLAEESADLGITGSIRPGQLSRAIFDYLNPRKRVTYYFDTKSGTPPNAAPNAGK
jgi:putative nucleotidyltransferase with HDIG domain